MNDFTVVSDRTYEKNQVSLGHWLREAKDRVDARNSRSSRTRKVGRHAKSRPFHNAIGVRIDRPPLMVEGDIWAMSATS